MATAERAPASWSAHRYSDAAGLDRLMLEAAAREHEARTMQLADHECRRCLQLTCTCPHDHGGNAVTVRVHEPTPKRGIND